MLFEKSLKWLMNKTMLVLNADLVYHILMLINHCLYFTALKTDVAFRCKILDLAVVNVKGIVKSETKVR